MKTQIYYFTGTGNSLKISKEIAAELGDTELISIPQVMDKTEIECSSDILGIVFPVYILGVPLILVDFIKKLRVKDNTYVFVIANHGAKPGPGGTLIQIQKLMKVQNIKLGSIYNIEMINNYTPIFGIVPEEKQKEVFCKAKEKLTTIINTIKEKKTHKPQKSLLNIFRSLIVCLNENFASIVFNEDRKFWVDNNCNSCGICEKICPVKNVKLSDGKPTWLHNCQQCMACFNLCPKQAIQYGKKSENSGRYKNPEITIEEILSSNSV